VSDPSNRDFFAAWRYHDATKHSYLSVRRKPHALDWANQPTPFKIYPSLEPVPLPREVPQTGVPALSAISDNVRDQAITVPSLGDLARILYFSAGVTRPRQNPSGEFYFRAAACTGALYEIELYIVCANLDRLEAGLYHFEPAEFALRKLRSGDFRTILTRATADNPAVAHAPLIVVCSGIYWRNSWKYQARTYRHFGWDNGTLLANLFAMATALGLPATAVMGFEDGAVNAFLDLDTEREVAFSIVPIGAVSEFPPPAPPIQPLKLEVLPISRAEVDYPLMREMHASSSLVSAEEVRDWREQSTPPDVVKPLGNLIALQPWNGEQAPRDPIESVVLRRGSARRFARESITFAQLSTVLERSTRGFPADFHNPPDAQLNRMYLIVHAVDGVSPGAYYFHRESRVLELLKQGEFRNQAAYLGLEQELPGDAAVDVFFLADLGSIFESYGNRGYRAAQIEAGILGGKLYLGAYAVGLGATGLTFYDDEVVGFFLPHAGGKSTIFLVALGKSAKRRTS
jgi:SagB-type dehydrogenase family enzyme